MAAAALLLIFAVNNKASALGTTYYYPNSVSVGAGETVCAGSTASSITGTISDASVTVIAGAAVSSIVSWSWYYNTTGATGTLTGATLAYTGTAYTAAAAAFNASLPGTSISTTTAGTYYYFLVVSWTGGTAPDGTIYSSDVTVVVNDAGTVSGPSVLCVGSTGSYSSTAPAGTWSSSSGGVASVTAGGVVTALSQGVTSIIYTVGSCTSSVSLTVNAAPVAISGTASACPGTTTSLADASTGGTWSSSSPGIATIDAAGLVTGVAAGTTTIDYDNGCGAPAYLVVTINPIPAAISPSSPHVCFGGAVITLSDPSVGGGWTSSNPAIAPVTTMSTNTGQVTGVTVGTATITYTLLGCNITVVVTVDPLPAPISGSFHQCQGSSITLTDAVGGGTWTSTTVSVATIDPVTGVVIGVSPGTTIITYTNSCNHVQAVDTTIAIPDSIRGTDSTCVGNTTTFADDILGGTWSSSNPSIASVLLGSGIITGVSGGTAGITYTIPPGCFRVNYVKINPTPGPIGGTKQVCPGFTTVLTNALHGSWNSIESYVASVGANNGLVTGITADTTTIVFTDSAGCSINTVVTVNPAPGVITGGNTTCATNMDTVFDATTGGTWASSNPSVAVVGAATGIITTVTGGTSNISYTLPDGCRATKVITVNSLPSAVVTYNFVTNSFFTDTFYVSYQWYDSAQGLIPGANAFQTAALYDGNYWVVVTDTNGCMATGTPVHYNTNMVGVQNQAITLLRIYPNPVTNMLHIESGVSVRAVITSIDGKTELEQVDAKDINTGGLANGMYFISLYNDGGARLLVQKLLKQ